MYKQIQKISIFLFILINIFGCGGESRPTERLINDCILVEVERGAVFHATVKDANGIVARDYNNSNVYIFDTLPTYPLSVSNGIIYLDNNLSKRVLLDINMSSYTNTITPITTILAESNTTKKAFLEGELFSNFGLSKEQLYSIPSRVQNTNMAILTNFLYKKAKETNSTLSELYNFDNHDELKVQFDSFKQTIESNPNLMVNGLIDSLKLENYLYDLNNSLFTKAPDESVLETKNYLTTDNILDIWMLKIPLKNENFSNLYIGIKIIKHENDGSNDIGEFVYSGVNISNGVLSNPIRIDVYGVGDSGSGGTWYDSKYNDGGILEKSFSLSNDGLLSINLGYGMTQQTMVSEISFKQPTTYEIYISASQNIFQKSSSTILNTLTTKKYSFTGFEGMSGEIIVK